MNINYAKLMLNSVYGQLGKLQADGLNPGTIRIDDLKGEQDMNNLVDKAMCEQRDVVNKEFNALRETYIKGTVAGKLIKKFVDDLNKQENVEAKFDNVFEMYMLSDKDNEGLEAILEQESKAVKEVIDKFRELKGLLSITETYEQKEKLLKEYGVLRYSK